MNPSVADVASVIAAVAAVFAAWYAFRGAQSTRRRPRPGSISSSTFVVAQRQSSRALSPAPEGGESRTRSGLPWQRPFSERLPEAILPSSSSGVGHHRLGWCSRRVGAHGHRQSQPLILQVVRFPGPQVVTPHGTSLAMGPDFLRAVAGCVCGFARRLASGRIDAHFETRL